MEIQNVCTIDDEGEDTEYRHYYDFINEISVLSIDRNPRNRKLKEYNVTIVTTFGPRHAYYKTYDEARACYEALKAALISEGDLIPVIDLLSFVKS